MENIIPALDSIANRIQSSGRTKLAGMVDVATNSLERVVVASLGDLARARQFKSRGMVMYVDMDGVLTDFSRQYEKYTGDKLTKGSKVDWAKVESLEFWSEMPWRKDAKALWKSLSPFDPILLTSPSGGPQCPEGKKEWVRRELGESTRVIIDSQKWRYASPVAVLIDDMEKNIGPWDLYGGIGILHKSTGSSLKELRKKLDDIFV